MGRSGSSLVRNAQSSIRDGTVALRLSRGDQYAEQWTKAEIEQVATANLYAALQEQAIETMVLLGIPPGPVGAWYDPPPILVEAPHDPGQRLPVPVSLVTNTIDVLAMIAQAEQLWKAGSGANATMEGADNLIAFSNTWLPLGQTAAVKQAQGQPLSPNEQLALTVKLRMDSLTADAILDSDNQPKSATDWAKNAKASWVNHKTTLAPTALPTQPVAAGQPDPKLTKPSIQGLLNAAKPHEVDKAWATAFGQAMDATGDDVEKAISLVAEAIGETDEKGAEYLWTHLQSHATNGTGTPAKLSASYAASVQKFVKPVAAPPLPPLPDMAKNWLNDVKGVPYKKSDVEAVYETVDVAFAVYGDMPTAINIVAQKLGTTPAVVQGAIFQHQINWSGNESDGISDAMTYLASGNVPVADIDALLAGYYGAAAKDPTLSVQDKLTAADKAAKHGSTAAPAMAPLAAPVVVKPPQMPHKVDALLKPYKNKPLKPNSPVYTMAYTALLDDGYEPATALAMMARSAKVGQTDMQALLIKQLEEDAADPYDNYFDHEKKKFADTAQRLKAIGATNVTAAKPAAVTGLSPTAAYAASQARSTKNLTAQQFSLKTAFEKEVAAGTDPGAAIDMIAQAANMKPDAVKAAIIAHTSHMMTSGSYSDGAKQQARALQSLAQGATSPGLTPTPPPTPKPTPPPTPKVALPAAVVGALNAAKNMPTITQDSKNLLLASAFDQVIKSGGDGALAIKAIAQQMGMSEADVKASIVSNLNASLSDPATPAHVAAAAKKNLAAASAYTPTTGPVALPSAGLAQTLDHVLVDAVQLGIQNGVQLFEAVNIGVNWQLANVWAQNAAQTYAYGLVADINATTVAKLQSVIGGWVASGKPMTDLRAELLKAGAGIWDERRASLIAVTEITRAYEVGSLAIYNQVEGVEGVEWATSKDRHVCRICEPMNGKTGKLTGEYPGGMRIPSHPGCRCWSRPVVAMPSKPVVKPKPVAPPPKLVKGTSGDPSVDASAHMAADAMNAGDKDAAKHHYLNAYKAALKKTNFDGAQAVEMLAQASGAQSGDINAMLTAHYAGIMADPLAKGYAKTDAKAQLNKLAGAAKPYTPPKPKPAKVVTPPPPPPVVLGTSGDAGIDNFAHTASKQAQAGNDASATLNYAAAYKLAVKKTNFDGQQAVNMLATASGMPPDSIKASLTTYYQSIVSDPNSKGYMVTDAKAQLNKLAGTAKPHKGKKASAPASAPTNVNDLPALDPIAMKYLDPHAVDPTWSEGLGKGMANRYGGVLFDDQGRILLREPTGHHDGYWWTFPKGGMDSPDDNPFDTALREVAEETGHQGEVIGMIPGAHKSGYSSSYFYMMRSKGHDPKLMDAETQATKFVSYDEAKKLINMSTNIKGRERDLKLLDTAYAHYGGIFAGTTAPAPPMPAVKIDANKNVLKQQPNGTWQTIGTVKPPVTKKSKPAVGPTWSGGAPSPKPTTVGTPPSSGPVTKYNQRGVEPPRLPDRAPLPLHRGRKPQPPMDVSDFPDDLGSLVDVKALGGSTGARLVKDPATGRLYVYKKGASAEHVRSEAWADTCYHAMGVPVPRMKLYDQKGAPVKLSEYIEGTTLDKLKTSDPKAYKKAIADLKRDFAADALMGNWDVAGMGLDNVLVGANGVAYRIDNGGSLAYRAQGDKKKGTEWAGGPVELYTMRANSSFSKGPMAGKGPNAGSIALFGDLSYEDAIEGAWQYLGNESMRQALFDAVPDADVAKTLVQRWDTMRTMATAHERLKADKWNINYIEGFTYHTAGMTSYGAFDKLPEFMVTNPGETRAIDQNGRPFDHLRGQNSIMFTWEQYVRDHGGDPALYSTWGREQGGNSWNSAPQAVKYYMVNQRNVPSSSYFWLEGEQTAKDYYDSIVAPKKRQYDATFQPLHAMTYTFLTRTNLEGKDVANDYLRLMRTEHKKKVLDRYNLGLGETKVIKKGAVESTSIYTEVYVEGDSLTQQWVPIERAIGSYFFEANAGKENRVFLGDGENELVVMMEGLPTTFSKKRY